MITPFQASIGKNQIYTLFHYQPTKNMSFPFSVPKDSCFLNSAEVQKPRLCTKRMFNSGEKAEPGGMEKGHLIEMKWVVVK